MPFLRQPSTVEYLQKVFDIYVLCDEAGVEYRNESNRLAFEKKRQVEGSEDFRRFLAKYNPERSRDADIRVEVDPYEDEGDGYTVRLLLAFPMEESVLPIAIPSTA